ncbi:hypothetical protein CTT30_03510 [Vibrio coralliilyticus]|nr:hypothetical protein CTT30_03510 [Vibrio coralliilyticus]
MLVVECLPVSVLYFFQNGFKPVSIYGRLLFLLCCVITPVLQNMSPNMEKIVEPCAF